MKKIIITGGSGFLGTQIINKLLEMGGYEIIIMDLFPPREEKEGVTFFKKDLGHAFATNVDYSLLENPYAYIHLAGKSIFGRFTEEHKQAIWDSRVEGSKNLIDFISQQQYRPESLVAASAVGFYGDQPGEVLVESSERKNYYYLSDVVEAWENENLRAQEFGINVSCIRNGHIIGAGGMLAEAAKTFKFGIGGILGTGKEHMPWIDIRDLVTLYIQTMKAEDSPSIINGVSTRSHTQKDFAHAIGAVKNTKFYLNIHEWMLNIKFGEFGREMLVDQHILSEHYKDILFLPKHTDLDEVVSYYLKQD
ncbi:MAG: NAD-dependent epimerase/dehydratase family protein [Candidatus Pacebacteria bacterium]|nr:NAD-dependent epimerase/dehydratase family protein [Candidatus Paceibacterota bacterium]